MSCLYPSIYCVPLQTFIKSSAIDVFCICHIPDIEGKNRRKFFYPERSYILDWFLLNFEMCKSLQYDLSLNHNGFTSSLRAGFYFMYRTMSCCFLKTGYFQHSFSYPITCSLKALLPLNWKEELDFLCESCYFTCCEQPSSVVFILFITLLFAQYFYCLG